MPCPTCQQENPSGARFCNGCGASFELACPGCERPNPQSASFCNACGRPLQGERALAPERKPGSYTPKHLADKILRSKSALEGERKQVTVLFADVKGSMELAEQVDPEDWHAILDRFFKILSDGVHRFEGTVNQYTGDGIMALFGAPIAHEDHAQRACYAALHMADQLRGYAKELRRERGLSFSVRMGLNSGDVVVGKIGDDLRMDYTALGQTVGLAARIERVAEGGKVYVADATAQLVSGFLRMENLGEFRLPGVEAPVRIHELQGLGPLRTRLDRSRARGFSRFVGRALELETLDAALERAMQGEGQVIGVTAPPGTGKSRLCLEFAERCQARGIPTRQAHAMSHGKSIPYLPIREFVRALFGIAEADDERVIRQKVAGALALLGRDLQEELPLLFEFLGVSETEARSEPLYPDSRQRQLFGIVHRILESQVAEEPTVILFEDLQWMDRGSEAFLAQLVEVIPRTSTVLLVNFREYQAPWMEMSHYQRLPLRPLGPEASAELLRDLLGTDPTLAKLPALIGERTRGNPFFIEEVVHALVERGALAGERGNYSLVAPIERIEIPQSIQTVLSARVDRLAESEKTLLQTAAVIGSEFPDDILARVLKLSEVERRNALDTLVSGEFLYTQALHPIEEYAFKHPLTHEVAYGSQLRERRARTHAEVARAIEEIDSTRLDDQASLLAHHWEQAGEDLRAARWHARAAESAGFVDIPGALFHWGRVRSITTAAPETQETREMRLRACGRALEAAGRAGMSTAEAAQLFDEGRSLAEQCDNARALVRLHEALAARLGWSGDPEGQRQHLAEAARLAEQVPDVELKVVVLQRSSVAQFHAGDLRAALSLAEQGLRLAEKDGAFTATEFAVSIYRALLLARANVLAYMGKLDESARVLGRVGRVSRGLNVAQVGARTSHIRALVGANIWLNRGDIDQSLEAALDFVALAERSGSTWAAPVSALALGRALLLAGRFAEARDALEESLRRAREHQLGLEAEADHLACLARAYAGVGDSRARATAEEAVSVAQHKGARFWELQAQLARAEVLLRLEGVCARPRIEEALKRAESLVDETGGEVMRPALCQQYAELARLRGDEARRAQELQAAHRLFSQMGATGYAERLGQELAALAGT
ncbi:MAG: AAA family ATPase [Myxococcales bacterium]|nr:AAA family ATPase [Myxococcales bacterium]